MVESGRSVSAPSVSEGSGPQCQLARSRDRGATSRHRRDDIWQARAPLGYSTAGPRQRPALPLSLEGLAMKTSWLIGALVITCTVLVTGAAIALPSGDEPRGSAI